MWRSRRARTSALLLGLCLLTAAGGAGCRASLEDRPGGARRSSAQAGDTARNRRAVERTLRRYVEASRAGDAGALAALYAEDAVVLPPAQAPVAGRAAIAEFWSEGLEPDFELEPLRIEVEGDLALVVGRYTLPATDAEPADTGKSVLGLRRERDGRWRVTLDIWNHSTGEADDRGPAPAPREATPVVRFIRAPSTRRSRRRSPPARAGGEPESAGRAAQGRFSQKLYEPLPL